MQLFQCDICEEQVTEPLRASISFERTPEELEELAAGRNLAAKAQFLGQVQRLRLKDAARVQKSLDFCRKCYDKFKAEYGA